MTYLKPKRILLVTHPSFVPPKKPPARLPKEASWRVEFDIMRTLRRQGHDVEILGLYDDLTVLSDKVDDFRPDVVFNLMEEFDGVAERDQNVVSFLELKNVRYTGCNPKGLILARHKPLAKKLLTYHGIATPKFFAVPRRGGMKNLPRDLDFPLIVKSATEESSQGISQASVVHTRSALVKRVAFIHQSLGVDALVEEYVEGREWYVGVFGNHTPIALPVWELSLGKTPKPMYRMATWQVKWQPAYRKRYGVRLAAAKAPVAWLKEAQRTAVEAYKILGLSGYARMDFRRAVDGTLYFLEANANPDMGMHEEFAGSAKHAGISYSKLLDTIVRLGLRS